MSNTYDTAAFPLGSTHPKVLYNNASNLDDGAMNNTTTRFWIDRFGRQRLSWYGFELNANEALIATGFEFIGDYDDPGELTLTRYNQTFSKDGEFWRPSAPLALPYTTVNNWAVDQPKFVMNGDASLRQALALPNGAQTLVGGSLHKGEVLTPTPAGTGLTRGTVHAYYDLAPLAGAIRMGASDLTDLNDERDLWRGLPSPNAWGDPANIGFASAAFNRNGASFAAYSTTFGHDCVTYGTASLAGGAGSGTGNADTPLVPFTGYCSLAFGKNVYVPGEKSAGLGEEHLLNTRASMGLGYNVTSQPSAATPTPVGAFGAGQSINLTGQSVGIGSYLNVNDGHLIGRGASVGFPLNSTGPDQVGVGMGTTTPALIVQKPVGGETRSRVSVNNNNPINHEIDIDVTPGKTVGITVDGIGSATLALMGAQNGGGELALVSFVWTHTNGGTALGTLEVRMNGRSTPSFAIAADGSIRFGELKTAGTVGGSPAGTIYNDAGVLKVV